MELRKEYAEIVDNYTFGCSAFVRERVTASVEQCQELADRPPKELTASEKYHLWLSVYDGVFGSTRCTNGSEVIDKIIAAFLEKQREPQVVKFRAARRIGVDHVEMVRDLPNLDWEWLDADGKPQIYEVKLP